MADLGGRTRRAPPYDPKFSQFHAVFHKIWQNHMLAPLPGGLAPPPTGNPGSAPGDEPKSTSCRYVQDLNEVFPEFIEFTKFRESEKSVKHELGSI